MKTDNDIVVELYEKYQAGQNIFRRQTVGVLFKKIFNLMEMVKVKEMSVATYQMLDHFAEENIKLRDELARLRSRVQELEQLMETEA